MSSDRRRVFPGDFGPPPVYKEKQRSEPSHEKGNVWSWPPGEPSPAFTPLPPYPAGPNLSNIRYPRDVSGPRYQCPECEQQFLFHRLMGIVVCPFCQKTVTVGRYNKKRSTLYLVVGLLLLLVSAIILTAYFIWFPKMPYVLISVLLISVGGFVSLIKAAHTRNRYPDAIRVDQY
ncbi:unnamed protein product, partial [Mesorhabditis belari]|uniref:Phosphatidylinositol-4,5-bisphosphate 4-phosphatase n=1 Tax=Mesorhabditis belari TaxID=2138241 RepID=A0AAF3EBW0_9BILA